MEDDGALPGTLLDAFAEAVVAVARDETMVLPNRAEASGGITGTGVRLLLGVVR